MVVRVWFLDEIMSNWTTTALGGCTHNLGEVLWRDIWKGGTKRPLHNLIRGNLSASFKGLLQFRAPTALRAVAGKGMERLWSDRFSKRPYSLHVHEREGNWPDEGDVSLRGEASLATVQQGLRGPFSTSSPLQHRGCASISISRLIIQEISIGS